MDESADAMTARPGGATIRVEVVYCPDRATVDSTTLDLPADSSVDDALAASGIARRHPGVGPDLGGVGIWGRLVTPSHRLCDGDRVELYRRLVVDPKEARRLRQRHQTSGRAKAT